jgi:hypothetical protein
MSIVELLAPPPPPTPVAKQLVNAADVGGPGAFRVMVRNGALLPWFGEYGVSPGTVSTPELRARNIALAIPEVSTYSSSIFVAGLTATWIYCDTPRPEAIELLYRQGQFCPTLPGTYLRSGRNLSSHCVSIEGIRVTSLERTMADVALWYDDDAAVPAIKALMEVGGNIESATYDLERRMRASGRPQARKRLRQAQCLKRSS